MGPRTSSRMSLFQAKLLMSDIIPPQQNLEASGVKSKCPKKVSVHLGPAYFFLLYSSLNLPRSTPEPRRIQPRTYNNPCFRPDLLSRHFSFSIEVNPFPASKWLLDPHSDKDGAYNKVPLIHGCSTTHLTEYRPLISIEVLHVTNKSSHCSA
jgi:hypothetical protein